MVEHDVLTWHTPLEGVAGEMCSAMRDGHHVPCQGMLAKRGDPSREDYVAVEPGETYRLWRILWRLTIYRQSGSTASSSHRRFTISSKTKDQFPEGERLRYRRNCSVMKSALRSSDESIEPDELDAS